MKIQFTGMKDCHNFAESKIISNMPDQPRQFYFNGMHVYDIVATMRKVNMSFLSNEINAIVNEEVQSQLHDMRFTHRIDDDTFWPLLDMGPTGYTTTGYWFDQFGVHAALPNMELDPDDVAAGALMMDMDNQDEDGNRRWMDVLDDHAIVDVWDQDETPTDAQITDFNRIHFIVYAQNMEQEFDDESFDEDQVLHL